MLLGQFWVFVTPHPPIQTIFEAVDEREDYDKYGDTTTYSQE